jgi:hypothetical protein
MNRLRKLIAPTLVMFAIAALVVLAACDQSEYRKLADANAKISTALGAITQETVDLATAREIDDATAGAILREVDHALVVNDEFRQMLKQSKKLEPSDRAQIANLISGIGASLDRLNRDGVLHIKNPDTQTKLSVSIEAARAAIAIVASVVASEVNGGRSIGSTSARVDEHERNYAADHRAQGSIRDDGRTADRVGSAEGRVDSRRNSKVPGHSPGWIVIGRAESFEGRCASAQSIERDWRAGRCSLRS